MPETKPDTKSDTTIYYILDPMCSWCWGFHHVFTRFQDWLEESQHQIDYQYIMGGLAPDSEEPMPEHMQSYIQQHWHAVEQKTGARFNFDFWTSCEARRSTWPACRAVIAAGLQGAAYIPKMIYAIQTAYYTQAQNPSLTETLERAAISIGLELSQFSTDFTSDEVAQLFKQDRQQSQSLGVQGFPALVCHRDGQNQILSSGYLDLATLKQRWQSIA